MRSLAGDLLLQKMAEQTETGLKKQLYQAIRQCILLGDLLPLSRLPSSRDLAQQLGLSRNTVLTVYEQLASEDYIYSLRGNGTFISKKTPDHYLSATQQPPVKQKVMTTFSPSWRGQQLLDNQGVSQQQWGAFIPGVPDVNHFPHRLFSKIQARFARRPDAQQLTYSNQGGCQQLQQALVDYLRLARSVHCQPEQILITEGIHQAIDLVVRMLCNPGDSAWVEEPGYWGIRNILRINGVNICSVAVDKAGMIPPHSPFDIPYTTPRLIFVTPSHQYPLGSVMSLARRKHLLALAHTTASWIVEDDYDSEFRFAGRPVAALQGLQSDAPVIYIGTFSKTLYPGLRIGYMVLPKLLLQPLKIAHNELYRSGHLLTQRTLAHFIQQEHFSSHIRRMRLLYSQRRAFLLQLIEHHLGKHVLNPCTSNAGLHLVLDLPDHSDDVAIAQAAALQGVLVRPLSLYYQRPHPQRGLLLGFACVDESQMEPAFMRLLPCITASFHHT